MYFKCCNQFVLKGQQRGCRLTTHTVEMTSDIIKLTSYLDKFWTAIDEINEILHFDEEKSEKEENE